MRERIVLAVVVTGLFSGAAGCKKQVDHAEFIAAINKSYTGHHDCVWPAPIKLPAEVDPAKDENARVFEALADAGLFLRGTQEKRHAVAGAKPLNLYGLSDKGHPQWTPVPSQPGYGNFCFGHFNVTAIDSETPNDPANPTQYTVKYQYEVEGIPDWVRTPESMRAFPKLARDTDIQSATATLVKGSDGGWTVVPPLAAP